MKLKYVGGNLPWTNYETWNDDRIQDGFLANWHIHPCWRSWRTWNWLFRPWSIPQVWHTFSTGFLQLVDLWKRKMHVLNFIYTKNWKKKILPKTKYLSLLGLNSLMRLTTYLAAHSPTLISSSKMTSLIFNLCQY